MTVEQQYVLSKVDNLINILSKSIDILELKLDMLLIEENWLIGHTMEFAEKEYLRKKSKDYTIFILRKVLTHRCDDFEIFSQLKDHINKVSNACDVHLTILLQNEVSSREELPRLYKQLPDVQNDDPNNFSFLMLDDDNDETNNRDLDLEDNFNNG